MGLIASTALGENSVQILAGIVEELRSAGLPIEQSTAPPPPSADAGRALGTSTLGWACGLLATDLIRTGQLDAAVVAAPVFAGESGPAYRSVIVARRARGIDTLAAATGARLAVNEVESWSGHHALAVHLAVHGLGRDRFAGVLLTGSHRASIAALVADEADVAAIDHTVWAGAVQDPSVAAAVRVIGRTRDWPAPPFTVAGRVGREERARLVAALLAIRAGAVDGLAGIVAADIGAYEEMAASRDRTVPLL